MKINNKVIITQPLSHGRAMWQIFTIEDKSDCADPKKSFWEVEYSTDFEAPFCTKKGQFKKCIECKKFKVENEDKQIYRCAQKKDKVAFQVLKKRIEVAQAAGCKVQIF